MQRTIERMMHTMQYHACTWIRFISVYEVALDGARDPGDAAGAARGDGVPGEC